MTCQSWWCGGDVPVELGRAPDGARLTLACGCLVVRVGRTTATIRVRPEAIHCQAHQQSPPHHLPPETRGRLDLLSTILAGEAARDEP
jgi:hypothetical protein